MSVINREWLEQRIEATKALIIAHEAAITAVAANGQTYSLDTGQTRIMVTRANVGSVRLALEELENRLATLEARLCGSSAYVVPGF